MKDDSSRLVTALVRLSGIVARTRDSAAAEIGLSSLQVRILEELNLRESSIRVSEFASSYKVTTPTVSDSIRVLESKGLISKQRDRADARAVLVSLTDSGRTLLDSTTDWKIRLQELVLSWDETRSHEVLGALSEAIDRLSTPDPLCVGCRHLSPSSDVGPAAAPHYCRILNLRMHTPDLRPECPEFDPIAP